jgi:ribosomal protein S18 acetylase RimI-like enzyme
VPEILPYEPHDQTDLERFFGEVWQDSRFQFDPEHGHSDIRRIPDEYQTQGGGFWLMRLDQRIVGTVAVRRLPGNIAEVKRLNVLQGHRGRGFGDTLFRHAISHATAMGFDAIRLDTFRSPGPALRLFERHGFVEIPRYNDNPAAEVFMELRLSGPRDEKQAVARDP